MTQIVIPSNIIRIENYCFSKSYLLKHIIIPSSVTIIGIHAFNGCKYLDEITIPSSVTSIGQGAFGNCTSLKQVSLPSNLSVIEEELFINCTSLRQVSIPPSVTTIKSKAFKNCEYLNKIVIPPSVEFIGDNAFDSCKYLEEIEIPPSVRCINKQVFYRCTSLKRVKIPESVTRIEDESFYYCESLSQAYIPKSVKYIGDDAFYGCNLLNDFNFHEMDYMLTEDFMNICITISFFSAISLPPVFIISIVWWSRLHPWFSHGVRSGLIVYQALECSWISTICSLVSFTLFYLMYFKCLNCCHKKLFFRRKLKYFKVCELLFSNALVIISFIFCLISFLSITVASAYALKRWKKDGNSIKCLQYIFDGCIGAQDWVINQSSKKQNDFNNWQSKMLEKAHKKNGKINEYYCFQVGMPALIFSLIFFTSAVFSPCIVRCFQCCVIRIFWG